MEKYSKIQNIDTFYSPITPIDKSQRGGGHLFSEIHPLMSLFFCKKKESKEDILEKLKSNREFLQNSTSTLLLEMEILNKLIYKSKNTHSKEKFFKFLERVSL